MIRIKRLGDLSFKEIKTLTHLSRKRGGLRTLIRTYLFYTKGKTPTGWLSWYYPNNEKKIIEKDININNHIIYIYYQDGKITGWSTVDEYDLMETLQAHGDGVVSVYVHSSYRGMGIGTKLVKFAIEDFKKRTRREVWAKTEEVSARNMFMKAGVKKDHIVRYASDTEIEEAIWK